MTLKIKEMVIELEGLKPGYEIVAVDSRKVTDQLDFIFHAADSDVLEIMAISPDGETSEVVLRREEFEKAGLTFEEMRFKRCGSNCVFCFVDQMPGGLRKSLYEKDDDYRFSFLYGNYITLNDIKENEIDRIIESNLSPLYVSVHAINREVRERLFGRPMRVDILEVIKKLTDSKITINAQVVLVPGLNDGDILDDTMDKLAAFHPLLKSVAIVPVGITKHREGLFDIEPFDREKAGNIINWAERYETELNQKLLSDMRFFHLSDEFYLLAGRTIPDIGFYGDFDQISNGVGLSRLFIEDLKNEVSELKDIDMGEVELTVVTGKLGYRLISEYILPVIESDLPNIKIHLVEVVNNLFGPDVTVSGLICGRDILNSVKNAAQTGGRLVLPPNSINHDGLLIDDLSPFDLKMELDLDVVVPGNSFLEHDVLGI